MKNNNETSSAAGRRWARPLAFTVAVVSVLAVGAAPASAAGTFNLFGSFWNTDEADDTAGGGLGVGIPLGERWQVDLRGSYYEELANEPLEALFDTDDPVFQRTGLQVLPVDAGLRYNFNPEERYNFYLGGGASYYLLDSDFGDVSDEVGAYALLGMDIGNPDGLSFFVEGMWRIAEATVEVDPDDLGDIDEVDDLVNEVPVDLNGLGVSAGLSWRFGG
jgi:hypothetical protein